MNGSAMSLDSELRVSPKPVLAVMLILGFALFVGTQMLSPVWEVRKPVMSLLLLLESLVAAGWLLTNWRPLVGRWFTILALLVAIHFASIWLSIPSAVVLTAIPVALAVSLISFPAAMIVAVGASLLLVGLLSLQPARLAFSDVAVALVGMWAMVGVMVASFRPMHQLSEWVQQYFQRAERFLEEARDRKAELEQTMESLAHANRQLALAGERMAALRMIAEEAQKAKTAFVANVSHELRTPLNMIIGLVDLMVETPAIYDVVLSPKMREDLQVVHRNCEHLSNMINDVLDLTRLEAGRLALHRERVDLKEVIDSSVAAVHPLLEKKQLALQVTLPDDLPQVYCDRTRIKQVILNLVSNAARFTEKGGIEVEVSCQDQHVVVSVADTGPGISPEDIERIFEPFYQGSDRLWRDKGGSGLGLSISKRFVELHGGRMWLESTLGVGTSFVFTLPVSPPVEHIARPGHQIREDWVWRERAFVTDRLGSTDMLVRPRVVVCDETGTLYSQFVRYSDEVEFIDARNLAQATRDLHQCPAHAVVFNMATVEDLWQVIEIARREVPDTPLVGCSVPRTVERALDAGALGYLIKPVNRADLERAIQAVGKPVRRVLVVDDDPDFLQLLSRMLRVCDSTLEVVTATSGEQALSELRDGVADLMLLDIVMPDMSGWELLERLAHDERVKSVPTFCVSAQDLTDQPPVSNLLVATIGGGLSLSKLLRCSLEVSGLLLEPDAGLDLMPG